MKSEKYYFSFFGNRKKKECFGRAFLDIDDAKYFTSCNHTFEVGFFRGTTTRKISTEQFQEKFLAQYGFPIVIKEN